MTVTQPVSDAQRSEFQERGFTVLERVIPDELLEDLQAECSRIMAEADADIAAGRRDRAGLSVPGKRYFIGEVAKDSVQLRAFLFSPLMQQVVRAFLGDEAYFFLDQFVVKAGDKSAGNSFSWHQDSGFIPFEHRPYLTCWCALDDITEENGTIYVLPYDDAPQSRRRIEHVKDEKTNDMVGYSGDARGEAVVCPAGSIAVFSSLTLHRSGANTTDRLRRVYLAQYSPEPIQNPDGSLRRSAIPVFN